MAPAGGGTVCGPEGEGKGGHPPGKPWSCVLLGAQAPRKRKRAGLAFSTLCFSRPQAVNSSPLLVSPRPSVRGSNTLPLRFLFRYTLLLPRALPPLPIHSLRHAGNKQEQGGGIVQTGFVFGDQTRTRAVQHNGAVLTGPCTAWGDWHNYTGGWASDIYL